MSLDGVTQDLNDSAGRLSVAYPDVKWRVAWTVDAIVGVCRGHEIWIHREAPRVWTFYDHENRRWIQGMSGEIAVKQAFETPRWTQVRTSR